MGYNTGCISALPAPPSRPSSGSSPLALEPVVDMLSAALSRWDNRKGCSLVRSAAQRRYESCERNSVATGTSKENVQRHRRSARRGTKIAQLG